MFIPQIILIKNIFLTKNTKFLSFLGEHNTFKTDITMYYLLPNFLAMKFYKPKTKIINISQTVT